MGVVKSHQAFTHLKSHSLVDYVSSLFLYMPEIKAAL